MAPIGGTKQFTQKFQVATGDGLFPQGGVKDLVKPAKPGGFPLEVDGKLSSQAVAQLKLNINVKKDGLPPEAPQMLRQLDRFEPTLQKPNAKPALILSQSAPLTPSQPTFSGGVEVRATGVRQSAIDETLRLTRGLTSTRPDIAERLRAANHMVVVVPAGSKLTDVAEFQSLRGQRTFDGRPWDEVRGVANVSLPGGRSATAIPEENLSELSTDPYRGNFSVGIHEFAHAIHRYGVTAGERQAISDAYQAQKARGGAFTDNYASQNDVEYFAQLTNAYFGRNEGQGQNGAAWIKANDPRAFDLLQQIYGPPRQL